MNTQQPLNSESNVRDYENVINPQHKRMAAVAMNKMFK